jgi:hypothetical protein
MDIAAQMLNMATNMFAGMPPRQLALFISFVIFSTVAVNAVFALHYRRVGKRAKRFMGISTRFPILDFNTREWLLLAAVFSISFLLLVLATKSGRG